MEKNENQMPASPGAEPLPGTGRAESSTTEESSAETAVCGKYVNLMDDLAFQWVFGRESNKDILIALLNELLPDLHIKDIEFYKQRQVSFAKELKNSVFDISCRLADGSFVDVEVQVSPQDWFADRCLYYSTYCIQEQVKTGQKSYLLKPVYVVSIDAFTQRHGPLWDGSILSSYSLREDRTHDMMTDSLHFVFVELDRFDKKWEDIDNDKERFYFCIRHMHELESLPEGFAEGIWTKLAQESEFAGMPAELKTRYIRKMTTDIDRRAQMEYAKRVGMEEGLAEGRKKGLAEGREKGLAEGREKEKLSTARKMKAKGFSIEDISDCTGLAVEEIEKL